VNGHALRAVVVVACCVAIVIAGLRWLRVAQREHYHAGAASRFAVRWWSASPLSVAGVAVATAGVGLSVQWPATALAPGVVVAAGPPGLSLRGRTSPLAWTRRLRTLAGVWAALEIAVVAVGVWAGEGAFAAAAAALAVPLVVDVACALTAPLERRLAARHVGRATSRLRRIHPKVVAITGSYGKTSTKGYVAHLVAGTYSVVASPASFNNRAGLARAINEHLAADTDVFVAEMGTYRRGEIAELCSWVAPDIAVITAVGPVHLERFGSEDNIVSAKAEILAGVPCAVLVVDDPRLASLADGCAEGGTRVWRVSSSDVDAQVCVCENDGLTVIVRGVTVATGLAVEARPTNVAAAIAVALELGVPPDDIVSRLSTLPGVPHRLAAGVSANGCAVLDDTYNANPAGARSALAKLARIGTDGRRRVVVTPGMVELGARQAEENRRFATDAVAVATDVLVVGRTNRRALLRGARCPLVGGEPLTGQVCTGAAIVVVDTREQATAWVRSQLGPGDVVLYENDLPDHYP
jgi:UDP-N-acetylmuramoyl-tripeptide--D-alanyl-D-alanine ligase